MNTILLLASLWTSFANPTPQTKPWTYWLWFNGDAEKPDITLDLEAMKRLGFGGILFFDQRGYFDDVKHIVHPPPASDFMSEEWQDKVIFAIKESGRLGLKFTMNASSSGGSLSGPWKLGGDAPKMLIYKYYAPETEFEKPDIPHYEDVYSEEVWYTGEAVQTGRWYNGGEGYVSHLTDAEDSGNGSIAVNEARRPRAAKGAPGAKKTIVRYGMTVMPEHDYDVDLLDANAVAAHYRRFVGKLKGRLPDAFGRKRTVSAIYTPSYEGSMPSWAHGFFDQFLEILGYDLREHIALLCGFTAENSGAVLNDYRIAKIEMFKRNYYGTLRKCAHGDGMDIYGESAPINRYPETFKHCDMLELLAMEDYPQGEFWLYDVPWNRKGWIPHANSNAWMHVKGAANAAHVYGKKIASAEAFTLMNRHWAASPSLMKPIADMAFADGINRLVYHTFTHSPAKYGIPGSEYFAGTHIGRHTTWHKEADVFVRYLWRIQAVMQQGKPVTDIAVLTGRGSYTGNFSKERYLKETTDPKTEPQSYAKIPDGFSYDLVNDEALARNPQLLDHYRVTYDIRKTENRGKTVPVGALKPDVEGLCGWTFSHRRIDGCDVYFLAGEGERELTFRAKGEAAEIWNTLEVTRERAKIARIGDDRSRVKLELPLCGSCFVVFRPQALKTGTGPEETSRMAKQRSWEVEFRRAGDVTSKVGEGYVETGRVTVRGPWEIEFRHPDGIMAKAPEKVVTSELFDFIDRTDTKYFAGTATYRTEIECAKPEEKASLSLGTLYSGLAHVWVNEKDCGTVWCAPWRADITKALKKGKNSIVVSYINNWNNMLIGDCNRKHKGEAMYTKSILQYFDNGRPEGYGLYTGPSRDDPLQEAGMKGPVEIVFARRTTSKNLTGTLTAKHL